MFSSMQKHRSFFRTLDERHPNFQTLTNSFHSMDDMRRLHIVVEDSKLM